MYISTSFVAALAAASTAQAFQFSDITATAGNLKRSLIGDLLAKLGLVPKQAACPAVWDEISTVLTQQYLANGLCTDAARAAIRAAFHDCFNGACDGSLFLAGEYNRLENRGLPRVSQNLGALAAQKGVGVADLIQFAAAHAIKTCPGGPTVPVVVGRTDSSTASDEGFLPTGREEASVLRDRFASKGFSSIDLAALIGAHTVARNQGTVPDKVNMTMDSTPGEWDTDFYTQTINGKAPVSMPSDKNMAKYLLTEVHMKTFAISKSLWDIAFVNAMTKMSMMGVNKNGLIDCTDALPGGSRKREIKRSNMFEGLRW